MTRLLARLPLLLAGLLMFMQVQAGTPPPRCVNTTCTLPNNR